MLARDLLKTEGIIKAGPEDSISSVISRMQSSHDAAFIFDGDHYMGILNPYYSLIKHNSLQGVSLVKHALFHPPRIKPDDDVERMVELMMTSRVHYLPVMDDDTFMGIISARRLLKQSVDAEVFKQKVLEAVKQKNKPLVSVYMDDEISKVRHLFEEEDVSKLVVIDKNLKLKGIMSYYDLLPHFLAPKQRMASRNGKAQNNTDPFAGLTVRNVAKTLVHTLSPDATLQECLHDIVKRSIGSVVIVSKDGFPSGIITTRDFLKLLVPKREDSFIELSSNELNEGNQKVVTAYLPKLESWIHRMDNVVRATLFVKEEKNGGLFKVTLQIYKKDNDGQTYTLEGKNLQDVLKKLNKNS